MTAIETEARSFIEEHVRRIQPLARGSNLASWQAATTGSNAAIRESAEARATLKRVYSERDRFERVRGLLASEAIDDPAVRRQLVLLDHGFTANQLDPETIDDLTHREAELEGIFYNFRAQANGVGMSNNELRELLVAEKDSARRRRVWEASKGVGPEVAPLLLELVRRRNRAARSLGFDDYYSMDLALQEIDEGELFQLLDDFRQRSEAAFRDLRDRLDDELALRYGVGKAELRPWHWEDFFCQEAPAFGAVDLDPFFANIDHEGFARDYFAEIGLPVDDVLARSDLYEREGKDQHAFCTDIDRAGDVRVLCNLRPNERWTKTLLHELGHAVYDKFIPRELPYLLHCPAHTLATEAIAMFFGRLTRDPAWLSAHLTGDLKPDLEAEIDEQQRLSMLVAARWMLVMVHFERDLYRDPEQPDLNRRWWDLVEDLQLVHRPDGRDEPDWATKIHLSLAPVYYHNYLLGELMASQLTHTMETAATRPEAVGGFLQERIFARGASLPWNDLLREATGQPLSPAYFVNQFVPGAIA